MELSFGESYSSDAKKCVDEATRNLKHPKLILFFSPLECFDDYAKLLHEKFSECITMGATTIVCLSKMGAKKQGLHLVAFERGISCSAGLLEHVNKYPIKYANRIKKCSDQIRQSENTICLEFTTAFQCAEESVLSALNSVLFERKIPVFGGSAGEELPAKHEATKVALNGVVKDNGCVFAIIHSDSGRIRIYRENIYKPVTGNVLTITKVDSRNRRVMEYDGEPATKVYAKELGISEKDIEKYFDSNPVGRIAGDQIYVTANDRRENTDMYYHSRMNLSAKVMVLEADDYKRVIEETKEKIKKDIPRPSFSIMCHCLARTLLFNEDGYLEQYARDMAEVLGDYIGFSGYGEQEGEHHFNQTMTVAVFE